MQWHDRSTRFSERVAVWQYLPYRFAVFRREYGNDSERVSSRDEMGAIVELKRLGSLMAFLRLHQKYPIYRFFIQQDCSTFPKTTDNR